MRLPPRSRLPGSLAKILLLAFLSSLLFFPKQKAAACDDCHQKVQQQEDREWIQNDTTGNSGSTYPRLRRHLVTEFTAMKIWVASILWEDNILPAMMLMTEQLTAVSMQQAQIIGSFIDAKHQLETQQVFQRLQAVAHKDYHPSIGMCEFGSAIKSLASSERKGELAQYALSKRSQDRNLASANTLASGGESTDKESRIQQFREKFCDPSDAGDGLKYMCEHDQNKNFSDSVAGKPAPRGIGAPATNDDLDRTNKDIDFVRTVDAPWTLDMDFTNSSVTRNEEDVFALAANLYGADIFNPSPAGLLNGSAGADMSPSVRSYINQRAVLAKRSVAENSFNAIVGMKAHGTPGSRDYLFELLRHLGVDEDNSNLLLIRDPSYWAQMEILTKKIFQDPDFYTNLYDTPANVTRKGVAIQAIGLMQKFDLYKSYLRNEANLSILLELAVEKLQNEGGRLNEPGDPEPYKP